MSAASRGPYLQHYLKCYWAVWGELSLYKGLLFYDSCMLIQNSLQKQILQKFITAIKAFNSVALEYPHLYGGLESLKPLKHSSRIAPSVKSYVPPKELLLTSPLSAKDLRRRYIAADLLELNKPQYLIVDYFFRY